MEAFIPIKVEIKDIRFSLLVSEVFFIMRNTIVIPILFMLIGNAITIAIDFSIVWNAVVIPVLFMVIGNAITVAIDFSIVWYAISIAIYFLVIRNAVTILIVGGMGVVRSFIAMPSRTAIGSAIATLFNRRAPLLTMAVITVCNAGRDQACKYDDAY